MHNGLSAAVTAIALVLSASTSALGQQPDSLVRRDSLPRSQGDSAARADSIALARELRRIRGEPHNRRVDRTGIASDSGAPADSASARQRPGGSRGLSRPSVGVELGISPPTLLIRDANGTKLHLGVAPVLGAVATWSLTPKLRSVVGIRASIAALNGNQDGYRWDSGRATLASVNLGLSGAVRERLEISASVGPVWLSGPSDVMPFESATSAMRWGGGAGVSWRVSRTRPIAALLSLDTFTLGGANAADPVAEPGWVRRLVIGMRYGA